MDGRVNIGLAVTVIILTIFSFFVSMIFMIPVAYSMINSQAYGNGIETFSYYFSGFSYYYFVTIVLGMIIAILEIILFKQWMNVLNRNILNTQRMLSNVRTEDISVKSEIETASVELRNEMIPNWAFWGFIISYLAMLGLSFLGSMVLLFGLISFIFFLIYLHQIFTTSHDLYKIKARVYSYLKNMKGLPSIEEVTSVPRRNIFLVVLLTIITIGIYWFYLIVKLSVEINEYVKSDELARIKLT
jgi:hypothetical protein